MARPEESDSRSFLEPQTRDNYAVFHLTVDTAILPCIVFFVPVGFLDKNKVKLKPVKRYCLVSRYLVERLTRRHGIRRNQVVTSAQLRRYWLLLFISMITYLPRPFGQFL